MDGQRTVGSVAPLATGSVLPQPEARAASGNRSAANHSILDARCASGMAVDPVTAGE